MSIHPVCDILLDVARAADPAKAQAAAERLSAKPALAGDAIEFDRSLAAALPTENNLTSRSGTAAGKLAPVDASTRAYKGIEQLVLKNLVENMLPREAGGIFGAGTAGEIWRSFLADQLAAELSKTVSLEIMPKKSAKEFSESQDPVSVRHSPGIDRAIPSQYS
ncbi:MAG TPA: rod-binding protein [Methylocella sp.]|nr:rod-binding protein [Methylocella sp.]